MALTEVQIMVISSTLGPWLDFSQICQDIEHVYSEQSDVQRASSIQVLTYIRQCGSHIPLRTLQIVADATPTSYLHWILPICNDNVQFQWDLIKRLLENFQEDALSAVIDAVSQSRQLDEVGGQLITSLFKLLNNRLTLKQTLEEDEDFAYTLIIDDDSEEAQKRYLQDIKDKQETVNSDIEYFETSLEKLVVSQQQLYKNQLDNVRRIKRLSFFEAFAKTLHNNDIEAILLCIQKGARNAIKLVLEYIEIYGENQIRDILIAMQNRLFPQRVYEIIDEMFTVLDE